MKDEKGILRILGVVFSVIVILFFLDYCLETALEGWNNPR